MNRSTGRSVVYVVLHKGVNSRVHALAELAGADTEIVFITSNRCDTGAARGLVVKPRPNPLGVLRWLGLKTAARFLDSMVSVQGRHHLYVRKVVSTLRGMIRRELASGRRVVVLTCVPPHAVAVIGQRLKRSFPTIRWVVDWQDLWSADDTYFRRIFPLYRPLARRLERRLLIECDANITTNEHAGRALKERFDLQGDRIRVIGHHLPRENCDRPPRRARAGTSGAAPRIVFMGRMFKGAKVPGAQFLHALRTVRERSVFKPELHVYGKQGPEFEEYRSLASESGMAWHGVIDRTRVVDELRSYDYLLLLLGDLPNSRLVMHLKLSEYLAAGPPILAVVPNRSAVADIVRRTGTGFVVPAEDDWADGLERALESGSVEAPEPVPEEIDRFSWRSISKEWQSVLDIER